MKKNVVIFVSSLLFAGCSVGSLNMNPNSTKVEENKIFSLNGVEIGKVTNFDTKTSISGFTRTIIDTYTIKDSSGGSNSLIYYKHTIDDPDMYFNVSAKDIVNRQNANTCDIEQISNLYFLECTKHIYYNYFITDSIIDTAHLVRGTNSYVGLSILKIKNYELFKKIKKIFERKDK